MTPPGPYPIGKSSGGSRISRGGGPTSQGGAPPYDFAKISQKLHEIKRIWTRGGARAKFYYVDPPLGSTWPVNLPRQQVHPPEQGPYPETRFPILCTPPRTLLLLRTVYILLQCIFLETNLFGKVKVYPVELSEELISNKIYGQ